MVLSIIAYLIFIAAFIQYYKGAWKMANMLINLERINNIDKLLENLFKLDRQYYIQKGIDLANINKPCKCKRSVKNGK